MGNLEVIAHLKIRPGQLEGFKTQVAEILRMTREQDTHTLRTDWFINEGGTECEVHEMFPNEKGLIEHSMHIMDARAVLFRDYAYGHRATIYGEVSQNFINLVTERMGAPTVYTYLAGLDSAAAAQSARTSVTAPDPDRTADPAAGSGSSPTAAVIPRLRAQRVETGL
jgi:hypothetical protein